MNDNSMSLATMKASPSPYLIAVSLLSSLPLSSLELSDTKDYAPYIRARLGTAAHFYKVGVLELSIQLRFSPSQGIGAFYLHLGQRLKFRMGGDYTGTSLIRNRPPP